MGLNDFSLQWVMIVAVVYGGLMYSLIVKWYYWPWMKAVSKKDGLTPLVLLHCIRYTGLPFLIVGFRPAEMDSSIAKQLAYGDGIAATLAFIALASLRMNWPSTTVLLWIFNLWGFLDILNAFLKNIFLTPIGRLGAGYYVPAVIVPALLVSHIIIFWLLVKSPPHWETDRAS